MSLVQEYLDIVVRAYIDYARYLSHEMRHPAWNNYFYGLILCSFFFFFLELRRPWRVDQPRFRRDFWLDCFYMFFNFFLFSLVVYNALSEVAVRFFHDALAAAGLSALVCFRVNHWPPIAQLLTLFLVRDFIHWWVHRLLHRSHVLWEFHKVHHSVKQMGFAAHLRFHWMETVVYRTLEYIPLAMIGFGIDDFFLVHMVALGIGHFNHSNFTLPLGPLRYVFNNPEMHIWHHAKSLPVSRSSGVNFGLSLSCWDYLFGTAYIPYDGRDIELGFEGDEDFPETFVDQCRWPPHTHHPLPDS